MCGYQYILMFMFLPYIFADETPIRKPLFLLSDNFLLKEINDTDTEYDALITDIADNFKYFVAPGLLSDNSQCREDSQAFFNEISKAYDSELWAMKMLDSSGSVLPHGLRLQNINLMGNFDDCLDIKWTRANSEENVQGKHCKYVIEYKDMPEDIDSYGPLVRSILERLEQGAVHRSICLPSTCDYTDVQKGTDKFLNITGHASYLNELSCDTKKDIVLTTGGKLMVAAMFILAIFLIGFTSYDVYIRRERKLAAQKKTKPDIHVRNKLIMSLLPCFSIVSNIEKLVTIRQSNLDFFNSFRFLARIWVTVGVGHSIIMQSPQRNVEDVYQNFYKWHLNLCLASPNAVDVFFFLSAFMTSYIYMTSVKKSKNLKNIISLTLKGYLHRYARLTPAYAFIIALFCTVFVHTAAGPFWLEQLDKDMGACQSNCWKNLLYVNDFDYFRDGAPCMPHSWFLSRDMLYTTMAPIFLIPLVYNRRIGLLILSTSCLIGMVLPTLVVHYENTYPELSAPIRNEHAIPTAIRRSSSYLLGLLSGYLFYEPPKQKLNKQLVTLFWFLTLPLLCISAFGGLQPLKLTNITLNIAFPYGSMVQRPMFMLGFTWIVFACCHGYADNLKHVLGWKALIPLGKIMYSVFLMAYPVQVWLFYSRKELAFYDDGIMAYTVITQVILSFIAGFFLYIIVECPLNNVARLLLEKLFKPKGKVKTG